MEADRVREPEPGVGDLSPEARELTRVFPTDRSGRTVLPAECPASRLGAAFGYSLCNLCVLCVSVVSF